MLNTRGGTLHHPLSPERLLLRTASQLDRSLATRALAVVPPPLIRRKQIQHTEDRPQDSNRNKTPRRCRRMGGDVQIGHEPEVSKRINLTIAQRAMKRADRVIK